MKKEIAYKVKGFIMESDLEISEINEMESKSKSSLKSKILEKFNSNKLSLFQQNISKGAILCITQETVVNIDGDEYVNEKRYLDFIGDLTQKEMDKLQDLYFKFLAD